ncbi:MAG: hypothetical protein K1000chlam2_00443 [Chlamydiae bacterium]|nr:hypothetical protein [Chlamydiota bacterium]
MSIDTSCLTGLPPEVIAEVLSKAEPEDYPKLSKTCKLFHSYIYSSGLEGENYKNFILKRLAHVAHTDPFVDNYLVTIFSTTFFNDSRDKILQLDSVKQLKKRAQNISENLFKINLTNHEMLELANSDNATISFKSLDFDFFKKFWPELAIEIREDKIFMSSIADLLCDQKKQNLESLLAAAREANALSVQESNRNEETSNYTIFRRMLEAVVLTVLVHYFFGN